MSGSARLPSAKSPCSTKNSSSRSSPLALLPRGASPLEHADDQPAPGLRCPTPCPGGLMTPPTPDFPLVPYDLSRAPELASLALVEEALHISALSLVAGHPTFQNDPTAKEPSSLRRARLLSITRSTLPIS